MYTVGSIITTVITVVKITKAVNIYENIYKNKTMDTMNTQNVFIQLH